MPDDGCSSPRWRRPRTCARRVTWSYDRGGCRFAPGHDGPCKPVGRGQSRAFRPMVPTRRSVPRAG